MGYVIEGVDAENGSTRIPLAVDDTTNSLITVDFAHHEIHCGDHFMYRDANTVANGSSVSYVIGVPTGIGVHFVANVDGTGIFTYSIYEDSSVSGSAVQTPLNRNRNSSLSYDVTIHKGYSGSTLGTKLYDYKTGYSAGATRFGGTDRGTNEIILKNGSKYLITVTSGTNDNLVNVLFDYYVIE